MNRLRYFTHHDSDAVRIELAGRLAGADVEAVHQAWQRETSNDLLQPVVVDITYVTDVDEDGRALLAVMHRFGARIIANSPESSAIAQPIVAQTVHDAMPRTGWFRRLIRFLLEERPRTNAVPARVEWIGLRSAREPMPGAGR